MISQNAFLIYYFRFIIIDFVSWYLVEQALTTEIDRPGRLSEPLVATWPGALAPTLRQGSGSSPTSIKVHWDPPFTTEGIKIKAYKVSRLNEQSELAILWPGVVMLGA